MAKDDIKDHGTIVHWNGDMGECAITSLIRLGPVGSLHNLGYIATMLWRSPRGKPSNARTAFIRPSQSSK